VSHLVLDASLALHWFLTDEVDRAYSLNILNSLSNKRATVPTLFFYEVGNGLLMACRRKRITFDEIHGFLTRLKALPIEAARENPTEILDLPVLAEKHNLTNYDAAYLALAIRLRLPLATTDADLRRAAIAAGVVIAPG
jgi:predicted nucleic acid-binding protein